MEWAQILVIILSIFLGIFLLLAIVLVVLLIKLTRQIKSVTGNAMRTAESFEKVAAGLTSITSPVILLRTVTSLFKKFKNK